MTRKPLAPLESWSSEQTWETFTNGLFHGSIRGVEVQKSPDDLERYRVAAESLDRLDLVVETGTRAGGSAIFFREELDVRVITIDKAPQWRTRGYPPSRDPLIDWVVGPSTERWVYTHVLSQIKAMDPGFTVMVSLDSDHHAAHVQDEIAMWAELVSPGSYLVIEDGCFDMWGADRARIGGGRIPEEGGPLAAINRQRTRLASLGFRRSTEIEGLSPISHSPVGWWRRSD